MEIPILHKLFDHLPEAVFLIQDLDLLYSNPAGQLLLPKDDTTITHYIELFSGLFETTLCTFRSGVFHVTVSDLFPQRLFMLRAVQLPKPPCTGAAVPPQLRGHLSSLALTTEKLAMQLSREGKFEDYRDLLSIQTQATCRILRLTCQFELALENWDSDFPRSAVDLAGICRTLSVELKTRMEGHGPRFHYRCDLPSLLMTGNKCLLEQLILSLLSNAIKSAGPEGSMELRLTQTRERAVLSVWNSGPSIPEDRLLQLFSPCTAPGLPRPNEGAGLDLWLSHRIAFFHSGVIMAGNRPRGGSEFTVSLPATPPDRLKFQSRDMTPPDEGFSPLLVGLSDALPHQAFNPLDT